MTIFRALVLVLVLIPSQAIATIAGSVGTVYLYPSGSGGSMFAHDADVSLWHDQGDNVWWKRDWPAFDAAKDRDVARLREMFGDDARILLLVYFPVYLADPMHGDVYLHRLAEVLSHFRANGIETALFLGRPEFTGNGRAADYHDVVHDAAARSALHAMIGRVLDHPGVAEHVQFVALYYLGLTPPGQLAFTEAEILGYNQALKALINARGMQYVQHVDGPFWEQQSVPNPNGGSWYQNGYTPASIAANSGASDVLFAESWAQGALRGGVERLLDEGRFSRDRILLMNDVPNCDDPAVVAADPGLACSGWAEINSVEGNNAYWFDCFRKLRLGAWSVWAFADAFPTATGDVNAYGSVTVDGEALTHKAEVQRDFVRSAFTVFTDGLEAGAAPPFGADLCGG